MREGGRGEGLLESDKGERKGKERKGKERKGKERKGGNVLLPGR